MTTYEVCVTGQREGVASAIVTFSGQTLEQVKAALGDDLTPALLSLLLGAPPAGGVSGYRGATLWWVSRER